MNLQNAYNLTHKGILALARAERQGIRVDTDYAEKTHNELTRLIDELTNEFQDSKFYKHWDKVTGRNKVNFNSDHQLSNYLYTVKKIKPVKTTASGKGSTDEEALEGLNIPELHLLLRIRKLKKLRDVYLGPFMRESVNGYIHPVFNLHFVRSYRSSSDSPNFQNIPIRDKESKKITRSCLYPRPGHQLLEVDFSQLEVAIAACYHKDPTMIKYIKDKYDLHTDMAKQIFMFGKEFDKKQNAFKTLRAGAKNGFVFPQFYGDYYKNNAVGLSKWAELPLEGHYKTSSGIILPNEINIGEHLKDNGIQSFNHLVSHLKKIEDHFWNKRFPVYNRWKEKWWRQYQELGYFDMYTGFRCSGVMGRNDVVNYPVQGAAFHCLLWCFIEMDRLMRKEKWQTRLIGQIHDSIIFDVHPDELNHILKTVKRVAEIDLLKAWDWIIVPLSIDAELCEVGQSWYHKEEIEF
jgi:DNA polymerase-1